MPIQRKDLTELAKSNGLTHLVVWAFDGYNQFVVTHGSSMKEEEEAANFGNNMKHSLGWPDRLAEESSLVKELRRRIEELEGSAQPEDPNSSDALRKAGYSIRRK